MTKYSLISFGVICLAACGPDSTKPSRIADARSASAPSRSAGPEADPVLISLCKASPSASAVFMDTEGRYRISLLPTASSSDSVEAAIWGNAEVRRAGIGSASGAPASVVVDKDRSAQHSLCELLSIADNIAPLVFADPDFSTFGINEFAGKVEVGLRSEDGIGRVERMFSQMGAPTSSYQVMRREMPVPMSVVPWNAHFRHRPMVGGVIIGPSSCTSGVVFYLPGNQPVMFTNAHCSQTQGVVDAGAWSQPSGPTFGAEIHDYEWACLVGGALRRCDYADLSAYTLTGIDTLPGEISYEAGLIYRRADRVAGPSGIGSAEIDTIYPRLVVTSMQEYPVMNQVVDKIGMVTGWSYGAVYDTCTTVGFAYVSSNRMYCQDFAHTSAAHGDSGGPVFEHYPSIPPSPGGNGIKFMGIFWGSGGAFSSVRQMRLDIGNFCFFAYC